MAMSPIASTSQDFYLTTLQKYGQGPIAPLASANPANRVSTGEATDTYTPSANVAQAVASAYATLSNADSSLLTATSYTPPTTGSTSNGFIVAIDMNATLALAAYTNRQNGLPTGRTSAELASTQTSNSTTANSQTNTVQNAIQAAQASALSSTLNLFA